MDRIQELQEFQEFRSCRSSGVAEWLRNIGPALRILNS